MKLEITTTPRETLVWAPTPQDADELRQLLTAACRLVLPADPWELDFFGQIPDEQRGEFDPARIIDVEIGAEAYGSLEVLVGAGHELVWHRWETRADGSSAGGDPYPMIDG